MMYMNKTKRNLILASAIINLISISANIICAILVLTNRELIEQYLDYFYIISYTANLSANIVFSAISFAIGLVGSILLIYSVRQKGKYFRVSQGFYIAGFIIIVICGGWLSWVLLFISMFIPDIVVINDRSELRREEKQEIKEDEAYEQKKKRIEELKKMRDSGVITEEEYKQKLFDLL